MSLLHTFRHWSSQIIPPLVLLIPFWGTGNGLWYSLGFGIPISIFCIASIVYRLFHFQTHKLRLVRPILCLVLVSVTALCAVISYSSATSQARALAMEVQALCQLEAACPEKGTLPVSPAGERIVVGNWYPYSVYYQRMGEGERFRILLSMLNDSGIEFLGGLDMKEVRETRYSER